MDEDRLPIGQEMTILELLIGNREFYALEMVAKVPDKLGRNTIYVVLTRMVARGFLTARIQTETQQPLAGPKRRLYKITAYGQAAYAAGLDRDRAKASLRGLKPEGAMMIGRSCQMMFRRCIAALLLMVSPVSAHADQRPNADVFNLNASASSSPSRTTYWGGGYETDGFDAGYETDGFVAGTTYYGYDAGSVGPPSASGSGSRFGGLLLGSGGIIQDLTPPKNYTEVGGYPGSYTPLSDPCAAPGICTVDLTLHTQYNFLSPQTALILLLFTSLTLLGFAVLRWRQLIQRFTIARDAALDAYHEADEDLPAESRSVFARAWDKYIVPPLASVILLSGAPADYVRYISAMR